MAREDLLAAADRLVGRGSGEFGLAEIIREAYDHGSTYAESTLRTHVSSYMCANAPKNHGVQTGDFIRIAHGYGHASKGARAEGAG